ncbi:hypothetical protein IEO21_10896 [Rhodonia placenta]|uniref:Uncharacterized protein n=1 Tax=Rhodonia placenta TaxID=104341 RepID=A0A8H7NRJ4_9APHY|nr:hypothetical protein IEO21_10896 [Postia placenta]
MVNASTPMSGAPHLYEPQAGNPTMSFSLTITQTKLSCTCCLGRVRPSPATRHMLHGRKHIEVLLSSRTCSVIVVASTLARSLKLTLRGRVLLIASLCTTRHSRMAKPNTSIAHLLNTGVQCSSTLDFRRHCGAKPSRTPHGCATALPLATHPDRPRMSARLA